jgi:hypothetical protein
VWRLWRISEDCVICEGMILILLPMGGKDDGNGIVGDHEMDPPSPYQV